LRGELLKRVVAAQETERQRIARELHDETGQALTAMGMSLRGISTMLQHDTDRAGANLRHLEDLVAHSLNELQRVISDLRPSHLDDLGLPAALRWYASEIQKRAALRVDVEVRGEPQALPSEVATTLFRVIQEALTNVVKHSGAERAAVHLSFGQGSVSAEVVDNGDGFDRSLLGRDRPSWGLLGIEERAALLGGQARIISAPGQGTCIDVTIPYGEEKEETDDDPGAAGR
jgi:two-component system, NarL family, sensor histidine kinase UhpB